MDNGDRLLAFRQWAHSAIVHRLQEHIMTKLRTLIRNGFDVVELLHKLVEEIDQIRDDIAALRQDFGELRLRRAQSSRRAARCPEPVEASRCSRAVILSFSEE
jgi:hypothetical protein